MSLFIFFSLLTVVVHVNVNLYAIVSICTIYPYNNAEVIYTT